MSGALRDAEQVGDLPSGTATRIEETERLRHLGAVERDGSVAATGALDGDLVHVVGVWPHRPSSACFSRSSRARSSTHDGQSGCHGSAPARRFYDWHDGSGTLNKGFRILAATTPALQLQMSDGAAVTTRDAAFPIDGTWQLAVLRVQNTVGGDVHLYTTQAGWSAAATRPSGDCTSARADGRLASIGTWAAASTGQPMEIARVTQWAQALSDTQVANFETWIGI